MASISVSEDDFGLLFAAANRAYEAGDMVAARGLDKLARKANAALTARKTSHWKIFAGQYVPNLTWKEMPSTLPPETISGKDPEA